MACCLELTEATDKKRYEVPGPLPDQLEYVK